MCLFNYLVVEYNYRSTDDQEGGELFLSSPVTFIAVVVCMLLNPDQSLSSFGHEAKDKFADLREEEARQCFYFDCFKMTLHNNGFILFLEIFIERYFSCCLGD